MMKKVVLWTPLKTSSFFFVFLFYCYIINILAALAIGFIKGKKLWQNVKYVVLLG